MFGYVFSAGSDTFLLVDFGAREEDNTFGLAEWDTAFTGPHTDYMDAGPGGTTMVSGADEYDDYQGVRGTPIDLVYGGNLFYSPCQF
jgi:hypothetical protein